MAAWQWHGRIRAAGRVAAWLGGMVEGSQDRSAPMQRHVLGEAECVQLLSTHTPPKVTLQKQHGDNAGHERGASEFRCVCMGSEIHVPPPIVPAASFEVFR